MKSTIVLFILALIIATVQAVRIGANAERMARGLPPRAPNKLYAPTRASAAKRSKPSQKPPPPPKCTAHQECCELVGTPKDDKEIALIAALLGIHLPPDQLAGALCLAIEKGGLPCIFTPLCCENVFGGTLAGDCTRSTSNSFNDLAW
ncbi:hypothetical protein FKP32DRAFT_1678487 [Trametes sanguinea]|nr:hypothetical protein FKP32DRAFT_1678487 [Trametes sanguinea]